MSDRVEKPKIGKLPDHRGVATWDERFVPLERFRDAARASGAELSPQERRVAAKRLLSGPAETGPVEGPFERIAVFGGVYSNHRSLGALLDLLAGRRVDAVYCLGDLGGFGPHPEKIWPLLEGGGVMAIQGNYEQSLSRDEEDCNCGYTDPRDNRFAAISYDYTAANCSAEYKAWMGRLPESRRVLLGERELLLVHGSPRRVNEFLFESTTPDAFLEVLLDQYGCDGMLCTHTGLHWQRRLASGRLAVNVGVIGRPANDGSADVWYAEVESGIGGELQVELRRLRYDHVAFAREMREEKLPEEFVRTILEGWWTCCLEVLPAKERAESRY